MCNCLNNYDNLNGWSLHSVYIFMKNVPKKSTILWYKYTGITKQKDKYLMADKKLRIHVHWKLKIEQHNILFTSLLKMYTKNVLLIWLVNFQSCAAIKKSHYGFKTYPYPNIN
jgi:hypothetical protein